MIILLKSRIFKTVISNILVLSIILSVMIPAFAIENKEAATSSTAAAEEMMDDFLAVYLRDHYNKDGVVVGKSTYRWSDQYYEGYSQPRETDFWLSAILFDSFNDVIEYSTNEEYIEKIKGIMYDLYLSFTKSEYHPTWGVNVWQNNTANDDICWWAMSLSRAYELTGVEEYLTLAEDIITKVYQDYDTTDAFGGEPLGGVLWVNSKAIATENNSKDMCSNGNSAMVCARLAQHYKKQGDDEKTAMYEEYAKNIYNWIIGHLYVKGGNGRVNNSVNYDGTVNTSQLTYNYGVCAGAAFELYNLTGEQSYLDTAIEVMQYAFDTLTADGLTIVDEGTGDGSGFKNIMLRVAADMCYQGGVEQFDKYIQANAYQAWNHRRQSDGLVGSNLRFTPTDDERLASLCSIIGPSLLFWCRFDPNAEYDFDFSGSNIEGRYEAELAYINGCGIVTSGDNLAAGHSYTGHIQHWDSNDDHTNDGYVEFEVDVEKAGTYMMNMHWYTRGNNTRRLSINGGEDKLISFNRSTANVWEDEMILVDLNEGKNKIRFTYYNPKTHEGGDTDPWFFLDYIDIKLVDVSADKTEYEADEQITFTITTTDNVTRIGLANENGKFLGKLNESYIKNDDGTLTWTITTSIKTKGNREVSIYIDNGDRVLFNTGNTVELIITEPIPDVMDEAAMTSAILDKITANKNEVITATVKTGIGVSKIGIFNESGKALGKLSQSYDDVDGIRTWTITFKIGSSGNRNLTIKAADAQGNWVAEAPATITIK